jgi:hypothetical protein
LQCSLAWQRRARPLSLLLAEVLTAPPMDRSSASAGPTPAGPRPRWGMDRSTSTQRNIPRRHRCRHPGLRSHHSYCQRVLCGWGEGDGLRPRRDQPAELFPGQRRYRRSHARLSGRSRQSHAHSNPARRTAHHREFLDCDARRMVPSEGHPMLTQGASDDILGRALRRLRCDILPICNTVVIVATPPLTTHIDGSESLPIEVRRSRGGRNAQPDRRRYPERSVRLHRALPCRSSTVMQ